MAQKSAAGLRSGFLLRSPTTKGPDDEALPPAEAAEDEETLCLPPPEPREAFRMSSMAEISFTRVAASMGRPLYPSKQKNCDKELLKDSSTKSEPRKLSISTKSGKPASPPPPPPVAENKKEKDASPNSHPPDPEQPKLEDPALPEALPGLEPEDSTERIEIKSMADLESCIERFKVECGVGQKKTPVKKDKKKKPSKPSKKESKQEKSADKAPKPEKSQSPPDTPPVPEPDSDEETPASVEDEPKAEVTFTCGICGKEIQQRKYEFFEYSCGQDYGYEVCVFNTHKNCLNERYKSRNPSLKDKTQWKNQVCVTDDCKELMLCVNLIHVDGTKKIYIKSDPPKKKDAQKEHELKKLEKKTTKNEEKRKTKKNGYQELKQPPLQAQEMLILTEKKDAAKPARPILSLAPRVAPPPPETTPLPQRRMAVPIRTVHLAKKKDEMEEKYFVKPAAAASRPQKVKKQKQLINIEVGLPYQQGSFQTGGFEEPQEPRTVIPDSWDSGSEAEAFQQQQQAIPDCPLELTPLPIFQEPEYAANEFPFEMNSPLTYPYPGTAESVEFQQRIIRALEPLIEDIAANCPNSVYGTTEPISKLQKAIELLMAISPGLIEPAQAAYLKELFASDEPAPLQHFITGLKYFILYHYPDGWYFCKNEEGCKLEQQAVFCPMPPPTDRPLQSFADSKSPFNESFLDQAENPDYFETTTISSLSYADRAVQPPPTRNKRAMEQQPAVGVGSSSEILVDAVNAALAESMQDREEEINRSHYHHHQRFETLDPNQQCTMYGDHPANQAGGVSPSFEDRWYKLTREDSSCSDENPYLLQKSSAVGSRDWQPVHGSSSSGDTATLGPRSPTKRVKDLRKEYERTIRTLQHQVTEEIEQNEIHQDFVRNLRSQIEIAEQEALRKEQQHRLEMEHLHMRLNQQDKHFRSLQSQLEVNQYKETFRDLLLAERRDLQWIHSSINHLTIIIEALRPENNPLGRQMSRYHFQELKERYLEMEQVHLNNISILEGGSTNIQKNIPVPKLSPEVCQAVFMTEGVVSGPTKEYMDRWLPPISRAIENMAREADVPFPLRDSIECEVAKELQFQDCAVQFDLKVAIQRIAARLRVFKPVPAPPSPACPLSSERLSVSDETGPICEICHEALGTEGLFTCTLCKQPQHRGCIRGWFKRSTSCPHCRAQCVFDGDLTMEEGPSQSVF